MKVASRCVVAAMLPLAMGISGDVFVVTMTITHSQALGIALACGAFSGFIALWFGYTLYRRQQRQGSPAHPRPALTASH